jgi:hypothetical protein
MTAFKGKSWQLYTRNSYFKKLINSALIPRHVNFGGFSCF